MLILRDNAIDGSQGPRRAKDWPPRKSEARRGYLRRSSPGEIYFRKRSSIQINLSIVTLCSAQLGDRLLYIRGAQQEDAHLILRELGGSGVNCCCRYALFD